MSELREITADHQVAWMWLVDFLKKSSAYSVEDYVETLSPLFCGAIEASGRVTVDRAQFERLLKPMQLYVQTEGIVVDFTGKGAIAFGKAFEDAVNEIRANPGDLDPLP